MSVIKIVQPSPFVRSSFNVLFSISSQILVYPLVDWRCEGPSFEEFEFPGSSINMSEITRQ